MSIRDQIAGLEAIDLLDADLARIDEQIAKEQAIVSDLRVELRRVEDKLSTDRTSLAEMDRVRGELTQDLRHIALQVDRSREKLSRSRNERESNAAQRELEELRKLQHDREDEIAKLTDLADAAKRSIADAEVRQKSVADDLATRESATNAQIASGAGDRAGKIAERARIAATIQSLTLRRYEQVRKRKGTAIARAAEGICQACHMSLPPMLYQKMLRGEILEQCPSCARILYYQPPATEGG